MSGDDSFIYPRLFTNFLPIISLKNLPYLHPVRDELFPQAETGVKKRAPGAPVKSAQIHHPIGKIHDGASVHFPYSGHRIAFRMSTEARGLQTEPYTGLFGYHRHEPLLLPDRENRSVSGFSTSLNFLQ